MEVKAREVMIILKKFANNMVLLVNIPNIKTLLVHNVISPELLHIEYKHQKLEYVSSFKYLGVHVTYKLGWEAYINKVLMRIKKIYNAMKILYHNFSKRIYAFETKNFFNICTSTLSMIVFVTVLLHQKTKRKK